jgi:hypothetical protein
MMFEKTIEEILRKLELNTQDLQKYKWNSLEKLIKSHRIRTSDKEAFRRFYEDSLSRLETVNIE